MKQPKTFLLLSVIAAVLVLGVAYAAVSANFTVNGTASAAPNTDNFKVSFVTVAEKTEKQGNANVTYKAEGNAASFTVTGLSSANDTVNIAYTIQNQSTDIDAIISKVSITNSNTEYFTVTSTDLTSKRVVAGGTTQLIVTVKLNKNVAIPVTTTITAGFSATSAEPLS